MRSATGERRCLISLSDGGEDAVTVREFDLVTGKFVPDAFVLPKGKQDATWVDENTLLISREWHKGELTRSGYAFIVKRLKRRPAAVVGRRNLSRQARGRWGIRWRTSRRSKPNASGDQPCARYFPFRNVTS